MLDFSEVNLEHIIVHNVGNKSREEGVQLSQSEIKLEEEVMQDVLLKYFLSPFKGDSFFHFVHESDLNLNEVYHFVSHIFEDPATFYEQSVNISRHLYEHSNHNKIKGGEFYMVLLRNCLVEDELTDALGLFKSENKETYLRVYQRGGNLQVDYDNGVNIKKLDKGCLIFNTEKEHGYKLCIVDTKSQDAQYWREDFLHAKAREDNFYHTQNFMKMCKGFVEEVFNEESKVDRAEQIDLLNKSVNYFKEKEVFDKEEFEEEVMQDPDVVEAFREYKEEFEKENEIQQVEDFQISSGAVKSNQRFFRSVMKLDKNFSVYIHGNREYVEKGYDDAKGLKYYKFFFEEEN